MPDSSSITPRSRGLVAAILLLTCLAAPGLTAAPAASTTVSADDRFRVLRYGDTGWRIRVLQSRLHQLDLHSEIVTSRFDAATRAGVRTFQARRAWEATGRVDRRTWRKLVAVTEKPTAEALHNIYTPGPAILRAGDSGRRVRELQARLKQLRWYDGPVTGRYAQSTVESVRGFQRKRRIPVTGEVDRRTLDRLHAMTREPTKAELFNIVPAGPPLDPRCTTGRVLCIDKTSRSLRWVVDGRVIERFDVRFGSKELPTREGSFPVYRKSRNHVSSLYNTPMPYAMFFSGGQAVHYSPDFAATGYNGASHGCVNVRDYAGIRRLFDRVRIGDRVIIYWS